MLFQERRCVRLTDVTQCCSCFRGIGSLRLWLAMVASRASCIPYLSQIPSHTLPSGKSGFPCSKCIATRQGKNICATMEWLENSTTSPHCDVVKRSIRGELAGWRFDVELLHPFPIVSTPPLPTFLWDRWTSKAPDFFPLGVPMPAIQSAFRAVVLILKLIRWSSVG